jgi:hypothetical protein
MDINQLWLDSLHLDPFVSLSHQFGWVLVLSGGLIWFRTYIPFHCRKLKSYSRLLPAHLHYQGAAEIQQYHNPKNRAKLVWDMAHGKCMSPVLAVGDVELPMLAVTDRDTE